MQRGRDAKALCARSASAALRSMIILFCLILCACLFRPSVAWFLIGPAAGRCLSSRWLLGRHAAVGQARSRVMVPSMSAWEGEAVGGGRADLLQMRKSFENSMDGKLIMEYVQVRAHMCEVQDKKYS